MRRIFRGSAAENGAVSADVRGLVMPEGCELAGKDGITAGDIVGMPLFCSEQSWRRDFLKILPTGLMTNAFLCVILVSQGEKPTF